MNEKEIAFIICVNDEVEYAEALKYIEELEIPEGYNIDVIAVREAPSMTAGYNAAMQSSAAKYKIYIHQDVFLVYPKLLKDLLLVFQSDEQIGMVGVLGCRMFPEDAYAINRWDTGKVMVNGVFYNGYERKSIEEYSEVMAIDGMFMATQYDIPWREDLFDAWDFYDISQSFEFIRAGKKVVVPYQKSYWTIHDSKPLKLKMYDVYRERFINNYQSMYPMKMENTFVEVHKEYREIKYKFMEMLIRLIDTGRMLEVCKYMENPKNQGFKELWELELICRIYTMERKNTFLPFIYQDNMSYQVVYQRVMQLRHLLQRIELQNNNIEMYYTEIQQNYSAYAVFLLITVYSYNEDLVYNSLLEWYKKNDNRKYFEFKEFKRIFWKNKQSNLKSGEEKKEDKKTLIILNKLTKEVLTTVLNKYDSAASCICAQETDSNIDISEWSILKEKSANLLVSSQQERLYVDYDKVEIYGNELQEYVKIFHNTHVPVVWYVEDDYNGTHCYSENIILTKKYNETV